jgi:tetratricopeptide (TPR) repeat protein
MRFLLPMAAASVLATTSGQALAENGSNAKPVVTTSNEKVVPNKPASFFLEEITTPEKANSQSKKQTKSAKKVTEKTAAKGKDSKAAATPTATKSSLQDKIDKQAKVSSHFQQGLVMQSMGMNEYAITEYRDALKEDDKFISTYNNLAQCLVNRGKDEDKAEALKLLTEAQKIEPNNIGTLHALAVLKESNKDSAGAEQMYKKVLVIQPLNMRAIQNLSEMYWRAGDKGKAREVIVNALKENPPAQQKEIFDAALKNLDKPLASTPDEKPAANAKPTEAGKQTASKGAGAK